MWGQPPSAVRPTKTATLNTSEEFAMKLNQQKVEDAVLAVLWLTLHNDVEAWKTIDWETMDRLHQKGFISDPTRRAKSVIFTEEGLAEAERAAREILV